MAVDLPPFDGVVLDIAPGANPAAAASTFVWEYAGKRRATSDLVITAGRDDEASDVEAGSMSTVMDDNDANLSPRNILGNWYGQLSNGVPVRARWDRTSDNFTRTVAAGGWGTNTDGFAWTPVTTGAAYAVNGSVATATHGVNFSGIILLTDAGSPDAEVTWSTALPADPTGANFVSAAVLRYADNEHYLRAHVELQPGGTTIVKIVRRNAGAESSVLTNTATAVTYTTGQKVWAKARADGPYIMVKAWTGTLADEPDAWSGSGTDNVIEGRQVGYFDWRINSNAGTFVANIDDYSVTNILWSGNVPELPPRWPNKSGNDSVTPIAAAGILRRLQQGSSALVSPLRRQLSSLSYGFAYYPCEDGSSSTSAASGLSRGAPAQVVDVTFAGDDTLPGASTSIVLNTAGHSQIYLNGIRSTNTADGYAMLVLFKLDTLPAADATLFDLTCTGTVVRWSVYVNATAMGFIGYDKDGATVADAVGLYGFNPREWSAVQIETNVSGGTVSVALLSHQVGETSYFAATDTYSGTALRPTVFSVRCPSDNTSIGHIWIGDNDLPFVDDTFSQVSNGYIGEQAGDRIDRLCTENGVPVVVMDGDSEPMGRQKSAKLVELLRECEAADQGVLYERGLALAYTPRVRRYNVDVAMALTWPGLFDEPPEPQDDDQRLRNQWTITRTDGSSATVTDQESVTLHGLYEDQAELNIESDDRLGDFAAWLVNEGTIDKLRWPRIKINLITHPELIPAWLGCRVGSRITIADPPDTIAGEVIDLIIEGYTETINLYKWVVELSCSPAAVWEVGVYDDALKRYDALATLDIELGYTDTWAPIICADRNGFYSSTNCPYDVMISGQRNTVLGMSAPDSLAQADGTFEDGIGYGWNPSGCTAVASTVQAHRGTHSALLTIAGSPSEATLRANLTHTAAPGDIITSSSWIFVPVARNVSHHIDWYNGASFLSRNGTTVAVAANTWTLISVTATAPASTTRIEYGPSIGSSPANGTLIYVDDIDATRSNSPNSRQLALLARGVDGFAKILPDGSSFRIANPARAAL